MKWYDIRESQQRWRTFNIFMGGRGIGKTYSAIDHVISEGKFFLYLRSTDKQIQISLSPDRGNPFKKWSNDHNRMIWIRRGSDINEIIEGDLSDTKKVSDKKDTEKIIGYAAALSTFENLRGVDFSSVDTIVYDEFIQTAPLKFDAFRAFLNLYESVNRNRELEGFEPVKVFFLANTQELNNPILSGFDLIREIEKMIETGQTKYSRGDIYAELCESTISSEKERSVLYRNLSSNDTYKREALHNEFSRNDFSGIQKPKNMREYKPLVNIDDIGVLKHKSQLKFYCYNKLSNKVPTLMSSNQRGTILRHYGGALYDAYARNTLYCDSFFTRMRILKILNL